MNVGRTAGLCASLALLAAIVADAQAPARVGPITPPRKVRDVEPVYPSAARSARIEGVVILQVTIDPQGKVRDAKVLRTIPLLDEAALDAVLQWEYTPMLVNGQPISIGITVSVTFTLPAATPPNTVPQSAPAPAADPAVSALRAAAIRGDTTAQVLLSFRLTEARRN